MRYLGLLTGLPLFRAGRGQGTIIHSPEKNVLPRHMIPGRRAPKFLPIRVAFCGRVAVQRPVASQCEERRSGDCKIDAGQRRKCTCASAWIVRSRAGEREALGGDGGG